MKSLLGQHLINAETGKVGTRATCLFFDLSESMPIVVSGTDGALLALSVMKP